MVILQNTTMQNIPNESEWALAEIHQKADEKDIVLQVLHKPTSLEETTYGDVQKLATLPTVWQYQPPVSVEALRQHLKSQQIDNYQLLSAFIQQVRNSAIE